MPCENDSSVSYSSDHKQLDDYSPHAMTSDAGRIGQLKKFHEPIFDEIITTLCPVGASGGDVGTREPSVEGGEQDPGVDATQCVEPTAGIVQDHGTAAFDSLRASSPCLTGPAPPVRQRPSPQSHADPSPPSPSLIKPNAVGGEEMEGHASIDDAVAAMHEAPAFVAHAACLSSPKRTIEPSPPSDQHYSLQSVTSDERRPSQLKMTHQPNICQNCDVSPSRDISARVLPEEGKEDPYSSLSEVVATSLQSIELSGATMNLLADGLSLTREANIVIENDSCIASSNKTEPHPAATQTMTPEKKRMIQLENFHCPILRKNGAGSYPVTPPVTPCGSDLSALPASSQEGLLEDFTSRPAAPIDEQTPPSLKLIDDEGAAMMRKAGVAVAGGSLVALGAILIPLPGPGIVVVGAGMAVLGREFPQCQRVLDEARDKLSEMIEKSSEGEEGDELPSQTGREGTEAEGPALSFKKHAQMLGKRAMPLLDRLKTRPVETIPPVESLPPKLPPAFAEVPPPVENQETITVSA